MCLLEGNLSQEGTAGPIGYFLQSPNLKHQKTKNSALNDTNKQRTRCGC